MASFEWTGNTTNTWSTATTGYYVMPVAYGHGVPAPAPPQTSLEWLDAEIERTCALARAS